MRSRRKIQVYWREPSRTSRICFRDGLAYGSRRGDGHEIWVEPLDLRHRQCAQFVKIGDLPTELLQQLYPMTIGDIRNVISDERLKHVQTDIAQRTLKKILSRPPKLKAHSTRLPCNPPLP